MLSALATFTNHGLIRLFREPHTNVLPFFVRAASISPQVLPLICMEGLELKNPQLLQGYWAPVHRDNLTAACKCRKGKGLYSSLSSQEALKDGVRAKKPKCSLLTSDMTRWPPACCMKAMCLSNPCQQPRALHRPVISAWKIALALLPQEL